MALKITLETTAGRILLALRAGPMTAGELLERFPSNSSTTSNLIRDGLVERVGRENWNLSYRITDAGQAACPLRNPLSAKVAPPAIAPLSQLSVKDRTMKQKNLTDNVLALIQANPKGIGRKELIEKSGGSEGSVDAAISRLVARGQAYRIGHGQIVPSQSHQQPSPGSSDTRADQAPVSANNSASVGSGASFTPEAPAVASKTPAVAVSAAAAGEAASNSNADPEFAMYNDGRLAIIDGDEILVLPAKATRCLAAFLGSFEPHPLAA